MNAVTKTEAARPSLIDMMAAQRNMDPAQFAKTVRATVMPAQHTNEQFAALMLVASKYDLDPILKEIYAFPAKGGGIVPIVSIDGWVNLINSHPQYDGCEFEFDHTDAGELISCTCRMFRKDRGRPIVVTEYLSECVRNTEPWKMKHRMLRHKTMIQAARYAFGFAGIYDEDEGAKIAEMRDVTPQPPKPPVPPSAAAPAEVDEAEVIDPRETVAETGEDAREFVGEHMDDGEFFHRLEESLAGAMDEATVEEVWNQFDAEARFDGDDVNRAIADKIKARRLQQIGSA